MKATLVTPSWRYLELAFSEPAKVFIASPWISSEGIERLERVWERTRCESWEIWSRLEPLDFVQGTTDFDGLLRFVGAEPMREVRVHVSPLLHTKMYWGGGQKALLASANLTSSGFTSNIEAGVMLEGAPEEISAFLDAQRGRMRSLPLDALKGLVESFQPLVAQRDALSAILRGIVLPVERENLTSQAEPVYHGLR